LGDVEQAGSAPSEMYGPPSNCKGKAWEEMECSEFLNQLL
jgi:hypothetical protein